MNYVLDACAMLAYPEDEDGASAVEALLRGRDAKCFAHAVNLCEVYYDFIRRSDEQTASEAVADLLADGVIERGDMDRRFWEAVGRHKARGKIALADCFCLALAADLSAELVTTDRREFEPLVPLGICPIRFIR